MCTREANPSYYIRCLADHEVATGLSTHQNELKECSLVNLEELLVPRLNVIGPLVLVLLVLRGRRVILVVGGPLYHLHTDPLSHTVLPTPITALTFLMMAPLTLGRGTGSSSSSSSPKSEQIKELGRVSISSKLLWQNICTCTCNFLP